MHARARTHTHTHTHTHNPSMPLLTTFHSDGFPSPHLLKLGEPPFLPDGDHHALPVKVLQVVAQKAHPQLPHALRVLPEVLPDLGLDRHKQYTRGNWYTSASFQCHTDKSKQCIMQECLITLSLSSVPLCPPLINVDGGVGEGWERQTGTQKHSHIDTVREKDRKRDRQMPRQMESQAQRDTEAHTY